MITAENPQCFREESKRWTLVSLEFLIINLYMEAYFESCIKYLIENAFFNSIVFNSMWNPSFHNWNIIKISDLKTSPLHLEQDKTTKKPRCFRHFGTTERKKPLTFPLVIQNQLFSYSKIKVFIFRNCSCFRVLSLFSSFRHIQIKHCQLFVFWCEIIPPSPPYCAKPSKNTCPLY